MIALPRQPLLACILALSCAAPALAQCDGTVHGRTICDGAIHPLGWTYWFVGTAGSSATAITSSACGSPQPGLTVTTNVNASSGYANAGVALLCNASTWNPDSVTTGISMSIDDIVQSSGGAGQAVFPLLQQGTTIYLGPAATTGLPSNWTTLSFPHVPVAAFAELTGPSFTTDPNSHPDFSTGAPAIKFGFLIGNSGSASYSRTHCYDNWKVVLQDPASFASYGTGCGVECADSFVEHFPSAAAFDLSFSSGTMIPNGSGYLVLGSGGPFVPPSAAATVLPLGDDTEVVVTPSSPFPTGCDGVATSFTVCSNGYVSLASGNGTGFDPDVAQMLSAPHTAWWCWHDYDPTQPGSGNVKFEEVGSVAYVTWDGVANWGEPGSASTFQFQFDLATGNVTLATQAMSPSGNGYLVGHSRGGTPLGACVLDLSTLTSLTLCCASMGSTPMQLTMLDQPVIGTTPRFETSNIPPRTLFTFLAFGLTPIAFDLTPLMPGCWLLHDLALPFGPIAVYPGATVTTTYGLLDPVPDLLGTQVYAQAVAWVGGLQTGITSNAIQMVLGY